MKITSVKGTNDYLPNEVEIRDYLQNEILKVYVENGFEHITTPVIEDIENLDKSDGGENLNLIFKIMKRGDKLDKALASGVTSQNENVLADMGLRYDLTLPLSRYFANNKDKLTLPMKCIQMDRVYRAERPQKGRLREFVQCDIDIIGSDSRDSEVELILITTKALKAIGMKNFKVKVNDRRLLRAFLMDCGFEESQLDSVCITFDKMDKVGLEGVKKELEEKEFAEAAIAKFTGFLANVSNPQEISLESVKDILVDKGFSIGFERIFSILMEHGIDLPNKGNKIAVMYDEGELTAAYKLAEKYRAEGKICSLYVKPKKMGKFLGKLEERGYAGFINVSNDDGISYFEN